jgi:hypothetical protein
MAFYDFKLYMIQTLINVIDVVPNHMLKTVFVKQKFISINELVNIIHEVIIWIKTS